MNLESFILAKAEKTLRPYRVDGKELREINTQYQDYFPRIRACLDRATYWHGTGCYHYSYQGASRYERVSTDGLLDVLDSIIQHDGLTPHHDPWIESGGNTVSLGTVRMHSRLFARAHLYEDDALLYELGSARFWVRLYMYFLSSWLLSDLRGCRHILKHLLRRSSYGNFQTWAGALRKSNGTKVISIRDLVRAKIMSSDIEGNYPILIGIAKDRLKLIDIIPLTHRVEVRSLDPVRLQNFTHIEVPFGKVAETNKFLKERGVSLEVLPLEFVDVYMADLPLKTLTYS